MLSPSVQTTARYDDNGIMGSGAWYGIPNYAEYVMVYYNKDLFEEHGVEVPTTFDELVAAMDTFAGEGHHAAGHGRRRVPRPAVVYQLALSQADRSWVDAYQLYQGDVDFQDDAWTYGAETFADWVDKGYIDKDSTGVKAEDMGVSFISGKYPIMISGSWWYGRFQAEIKDFEWGTFLFPGSTLTLGSGGNLWVVPENSEAQGPRLRLHRHHHVGGDPEHPRQQRRRPGRRRPDGDHRPEEPGADRELPDPLRQRRPGVLPGLAVAGLLRRLGVGDPEAHDG